MPLLLTSEHVPSLFVRIHVVPNRSPLEWIGGTGIGPVLMLKEKGRGV